MKENIDYNEQKTNENSASRSTITKFNFPFYIADFKNASKSKYYLVKVVGSNNTIELYKLKSYAIAEFPVDGVFHSSTYDIKYIEDLIRKYKGSYLDKISREPIYGIGLLTHFNFTNISYRFSEYYVSTYYVFIPREEHTAKDQIYKSFYISAKMLNQKGFKIGYFMFVAPDNIVRKIKEDLKVEDKALIEVIDNSKEEKYRKYVFEISFMSKEWSLSRDTKTYPLVMTIPFISSPMSGFNRKINDNVLIGISSSPIMEKDIGTILTYKISNYISRQLPFIILRPGYLSKGKNSPTNIIVNPGTISFSFSIPEKFLNNMKEELYYYLRKAIELVSFDIELVNNTFFGKANNDAKYIIDPKLLFKALMFGIDHLKGIKFTNNGNINALKYLARFTRNIIKCFEKEEIILFMKEKSADLSGGLYLCFTRAQRFEDQVYNILRNYKSFCNQNQNKVKPQICLFAAYLKALYDYISKKMGLHDLKIKIDTYEFVNRIVINMIELGIHGLAHILRKAVASFLNIRENDLGYYIINYSYLYKRNILLDGYLLRMKHLSLNITSKSILSMYLRSNHSYYTLYSNIHSRIDELLEHVEMVIKNVLGDNSFDPCYLRYVDKAGIAKSSLEFALASAHSSFNLGLIEDLLSEYIDLYSNETGKVSPDKLVYQLYLPRPELRRLIVKIVDEYNAHSETKISLEELRRYMPAVLEYIVPNCFDGCYGCVVSRYCNVRNPLVKEWIVSKQMAKLIYQSVFKDVLKL